MQGDDHDRAQREHHDDSGCRRHQHLDECEPVLRASSSNVHDVVAPGQAVFCAVVMVIAGMAFAEVMLVAELSVAEPRK